MALQFKIHPSAKSYASEDNAIEAVKKLQGLDGVRYVILPAGKDGKRFAPLFILIGDQTKHMHLAHLGFTVIG